LDLATILSPCSVAVFLDQYFGSSVLHVAGFAGKFAGVEPGMGELISEIARTIEQRVEAPVHTRLVRGSEDAAYRNDRDALILQLSGHSESRVQSTAEGATEQTLVWQGMLREGDALYIPAGCQLVLRPQDPEAMELCFEIENPTGGDLLDWIAGYIQQHPTFRKPIPRFADPGIRADYVRDLRRLLATIFRDPKVLERYRREKNLEPTPPVGGEAIGWTGDGPDTREIAMLAPRRMRIKRADLDTLILVGAGKRLAFPVDAAPLLHYLCDQAPVSIRRFMEDFEKEFDHKELSEFLEVLSKEGIIGWRGGHS
jgi:hypothetical protein